MPSARSEAGYRLYDEADLARLQQVLLYRELEFSLADIRRILDAPDFDRGRALEQQIGLLRLRREHIDSLIALAEGMRAEGAAHMSFDAFDTTRLDEYAAKAREAWGGTPQWAEYEQRRAGKTLEQERAQGEGMMELFVPFARLAAEGANPACDEAQAQVAAIQAFITEHYYTCTDEVMAQLGQAYGCGGEFTRNINAAAGPGAGEFAARAVAARYGQA